MPEGNSSRLAAKANKLYWQTSQPAGRLADELGVSRSKLYAMIEPIHPGRGHCPECGKVTEVAAAPKTKAKATAPAKADEPAVRLPSATTVRDWASSTGPREIWAVALIGAAAGLLAAAWWRKR
jgi:hypothetical protein